MSLRATGVAILVLLLGGCSMLPPQPTEAALAQRMEARRLALTSWRFKARLQTASQRGSVRWQQEGEAFDVLIRGPFGFGGLRLRGTPERVEIDDGKQRLVSDAPERDLYQRSGFRVPLGALSYWARGLPAPGLARPLVRRDAAGYIRLIEQAGWRIELDDYQEAQGLWFPFTLRLGVEMQWLDIEISQWSL